MSCAVAAVVPSLGGVAGLDETLTRLRRELAAVDGELIWVHQGDRATPALDRPRERLLRLAAPVGFAAAVNAGLALADAEHAGHAEAAEWIAVVNDDAWLEPGWLAALLAVGAGEPSIVALQGVNLQLASPARIDGAGIAWNRRWQALQLGRGEAATLAGATPFEVFGVAATAALYRRAALEALPPRRGGPFDERLGSWYEDVELAVRLAARGGRSLTVPAARALHRGSATGASVPFTHRRLLTRNRWLVTARLLGRRWPLAWPALVRGDLGELAAALRTRRVSALAALVAGWAGALVRLPGFAHAGRPAIAAADLFRGPLSALPTRLPLGSPK